MMSQGFLRAEFNENYECDKSCVRFSHNMRNIKVLRVSERKNFSHVYDDDAYIAAAVVENGKRIFL